MKKNSRNTTLVTNSHQSKTIGKTIAAVVGAIATFALLMTNIDSIVETTKKWLGLSGKVPAQLVIEDIRLVQGSDSHPGVGSWQLTVITADMFENRTRQLPSIDEAWGSLYKAREGLHVRKRSCGIDAPVSFLESEAILTVAFDQVSQERASEQPQANSLDVVVYRGDWMYKSDLTEVGTQIVGRPIPNEPVEKMAWCNQLSIAVDRKSLVKPPMFQIIFRNTSLTPATLLRFQVKPIRSYGGEAGAGGVAIKPVGLPTEVSIAYDSIITKNLADPINLDSNQTTMLQIAPNVIDAAPGDGPGSLLFKLVLQYFDGIATKDIFIGNFLLSDDVPDVTLQ